MSSAENFIQSAKLYTYFIPKTTYNNTIHMVLISNTFIQKGFRRSQIISQTINRLRKKNSVYKYIVTPRIVPLIKVIFSFKFLAVQK